jgi:tetratricopeptide (TPR) repeat protein
VVLTLAVGAGGGTAHAKGAAKADDKKKDDATAQAVPGDLADFLEKPAKQAMDQRKYGRAVSIYEGIVAIRGDGDAAMLILGDAYRLNQDAASAQLVFARLRDATKDEKLRAQAVEKLDQTKNADKGFVKGQQKATPATDLAKEAFKRGRAAYAKKKYDVAALYYKAGIRMDPDLPGNYRELADALDKLGKKDEATQFFVSYLQKRPFGVNAKEVRDRLRSTKILGTLTVKTSLPCDQILIGSADVGGEGEVIDKQFLGKPIEVAPGTYRAMCANDKYALYYNEFPEVKSGQATVLSFDWAIIVVKLDPWGHVAIENPLDAASSTPAMQDIGTMEEIGVPVPKDRRALKVRIEAGDHSKTKNDFIKLEPGKTYELKW